MYKIQFKKIRFKKSVVVFLSELNLCGRSLQTTGRSVWGVEGPRKTVLFKFNENAFKPAQVSTGWNLHISLLPPQKAPSTGN